MNQCQDQNGNHYLSVDPCDQESKEKLNQKKPEDTKSNQENQVRENTKLIRDRDFLHECKSSSVTFDEFRVKTIRSEISVLDYCEISAAIRLINCTNEFKRIYATIQGVDSQGFSLFNSGDSMFSSVDSLSSELDGYSQKKVSKPLMLNCGLLKKIKTWKVEVKAY
ncbi:MAG: hypothetical protein HQL84_07300 [Magnetococcales bacterium]|nr:hypothetical protein [Magnetococcales bacterium]MBF0149836.1 hypothetical protein [Magnetococcales bacterium]